jgi:hypothetical protein
MENQQKTYKSQTEGIEASELPRRKAAEECKCCAWPKDRKGSHKTLDCFRSMQQGQATAPFPKTQPYEKKQIKNQYRNLGLY